MSDSTMLIRRKGICTNPDCDMCLSREVQEIEPGEDFVCAECGAPLKDAGKIPTPGGDTPPNKLIPIIIGVVAILLGGGAAWYFLSGNGSNSGNATGLSFTIEGPSELKIGDERTLEVVSETGTNDEALTWTSSNETVVSVDNSGKVKALAEGTAQITAKNEVIGAEATLDVNVKKKNGGNNNGTAPTQPSKLNLTYGSWDGPVAGGQPNGMGTFTFSKSLTIDLKDGYGSTASANAGDKIVGAKFKNGKLQQGELQRTNGERVMLIGLNQEL